MLIAILAWLSCGVLAAGWGYAAFLAARPDHRTEPSDLIAACFIVACGPILLIPFLGGILLGSKFHGWRWPILAGVLSGCGGGGADDSLILIFAFAWFIAALLVGVRPYPREAP